MCVSSSHSKWILRRWLELEERDSWLCSAAKSRIVNMVDFHCLFLLPTENPVPASLLFHAGVFTLVSF